MDSQDSMSTLLALLVIITFVAVGLLYVVINQNRKIQELQTPKYGFLGKTLSFMISLGFLASSGYFLYSGFFPSNNSPGVNVGSEEYILQINYAVVDSSKNIFKFNFVPLINNVAWKASDEVKFDVYWTITTTQPELVTEPGISRLNPGGVTRTLIVGSNKIEAKIFVSGRELKKEITINISPTQ